MLLDHHRNTAPRPARVGAGLVTLAVVATAVIALTVSPRLALAQSVVSPQDESSVDELFGEPVDTPRSKTNRSTSSSTTANSGLSVPEGNPSSLDLSLDPTEPVVAVESVPQPLNVPSPRSPEASIRLHSTGSNSSMEMIKPSAAPKERRHGVSSIRRRTTARPITPAVPAEIVELKPHHVEVQVGAVPSQHPSPYGFHASNQPEPRRFPSTHQNSALEKRIKALEKLVHRLIKDDTHQHQHETPWSDNHTSASRGLSPFPEGDSAAASDDLFSHVTAALNENLGDASLNPFLADSHADHNIRQAAQLAAQHAAHQAAQIANNHARHAERYARQAERIAIEDSMRGLEMLKEQRALLEAERKRLNDQIKALDKKVKSLDRKMAQEMVEFEVHHGLFDELNATESSDSAVSAE